MAKRMLIDALHTEETRVVIADQNQVYDFDFVSTAKKQLKGNIYLAKITRVEPSLQAAFVEYGGGKQGFLPFSEIHVDYYQIPVSDRKRLMEEAARDNGDDDGEASAAQDATNAAGATDDMYASEAPLDAGEIAIDESVPMGELPLAPAIHIDESAPVEPESEDASPAYLQARAEDISIGEPAELPDLEVGRDPLAVEPAGESDAFPLADLSESEAKNPESQASEEVETIASDDDEYEARPKQNQFFKRYKIQEVIRRGQIVLVQVIKEERGNKGVSLTTYLSLAGRYCVLMPNSPKDGGISRKIASADDRKRLKAISTELRLAQGMSVIIRTAGMDRTRAEIKRDFDYLVKLWNLIREDTLQSSAPALIYEESDIIKRAIRDQYTNDIDEVLIEGEAGYRVAKDFMKMLLPSHTVKIKQHKEATPLFYAYGIEEQLLSMHDPIVKLRSGGYIVINPTEALISVDVNSGRSTGERNIEETAVKTNIEAANEVARQLRLRDLAGLIVIDFIDMMESRHRRAVEKTLKDALKADRAKIQLGRISPFGLLEMSRQRLRPSIAETNMVTCPHCVGRGFIRSNESMSIQLIRAIEKEASSGSWGGLRVLMPQVVALHMLNNKRDVLRALEERYGITIQILIDSDLTASDFTIEKMRRSQGGDREQAAGEPRRSRGGRDRDRDRSRNERPDRSDHTPVVATYDEPVSEDEASEENAGAPRDENASEGDRACRSRGRRRRGGRRDGGRDGQREPRPQNSENMDGSVGEQAASEGSESAPVSEGNGEEGSAERPRNPRPRGERGGRGRRRWRDRPERAAGENAGEGAEASTRPDAPLAPENRMRDDAPPRPQRAPSRPHLVETTRHMPSPPAPAPAPMMESTPRDPSAPPKKGWWKKMIDLDS